MTVVGIASPFDVPTTVAQGRIDTMNRPADQHSRLSSWYDVDLHPNLCLLHPQQAIIHRVPDDNPMKVCLLCLTDSFGEDCQPC